MDTKTTIASYFFSILRVFSPAQIIRLHATSSGGTSASQETCVFQKQMFQIPF